MFRPVPVQELVNRIVQVLNNVRTERAIRYAYLHILVQQAEPDYV